MGIAKDYWLTVKELKALLDRCDDSWYVISPIDEEGNGYNIVQGLSMAKMYVDEYELVLVHLEDEKSYEERGQELTDVIVVEI